MRISSDQRRWTADDGRKGPRAFKFEKLEVWRLDLAYVDVIYEIAEQLPCGEAYNLKSQTRRAATSVALNIAEGSTGQTDAEQRGFWVWRCDPCWRRWPANT